MKTFTRFFATLAFLFFITEGKTETMDAVVHEVRGVNVPTQRDLSMMKTDEVRALADKGDAEAQAELGDRYRVGNAGLGKDEVEAANWYRKAAEQGNAKGQRKLGMAYAIGLGLAKDEAEAVKWFRKAADQGFA